MIGLLATPPFSRITLWVAMETMHFHKTQTDLAFMKTSFAFRSPNEQFGIHEKLSGGEGGGAAR